MSARAANYPTLTRLVLPAFAIEKLRSIVDAAEAGTMRLDQAECARKWFDMAINVASPKEQK